MQLLRKQVMLSKWIDKHVKVLAKKHGISESEVIRIALLLLYVDANWLTDVLNIEDYEHKIRKEVDGIKVVRSAGGKLNIT